MKVAYAGEPGAFGEEAARLLPDAEPLPCPTFAAVFEAVTSGKADRGVVPLHNSRAGNGRGGGEAPRQVRAPGR